MGDERLKKQGEVYGQFFKNAAAMSPADLAYKPNQPDPNAIPIWTKLYNLATQGSIYSADPSIAQEFPSKPKR